MRTTHTQQDGITLLITLIVMGVLLGISASIMHITLKQYQLSGIAYASEIAFQAATAGMECSLNHEYNYAGGEGFDTGAPETETISCFDEPDRSISGIPVAGARRFDFEFTWGSPEVCSRVQVHKFTGPTSLIVDGRNMDIDRNGNGEIDGGDICPTGSVCTVVQSRGYNVPCSAISSGSRVVEREYTQVY